MVIDGSQTATLTTEHTLIDLTAGGIGPAPGYLQLVVDISALVGGEDLEILVYEAVRAGGTVRVVERVFVTGGQNDPVLKTNMHACTNGAKFTLKQTGGTGRAFPWELRAV